MSQEFRRRTFRGAKIEDIIIELQKLSQLCEEKINKYESLERQRFYEGMSIAYMTISLKLKEEFDYNESDSEVIEQLYIAVENNKNNKNNAATTLNHIETCSFCGRHKDEVGELALGPTASICINCLKFGEKVIKANS
ncbi:ClpX C4-type zinc finger protein [Thermoflavimicrobium daqui]|jgi:hypothetical protein|uniref:ClpX-type ZB domain-containing protein n=1 Tax=Thermoflavimicrobium daqui TaxID=2137476 RepID=A0A364K5Q0_9BACL|nr:ClpX C4-type zinc finger protein [Thermoflavimicrobium daqui]RAL25635.1 hypothetical protein DL897_06030 [Thermoflavimicrobium daqui]